MTNEDKAKLIYSITGDVERFTQTITGDKQVTVKYKLIDILNKRANGELKEGTKVIRKNVEGFADIEYTYIDGDLEREGWDGETIYIFDDICGRNLNDEVELIEPEHIREDTKMIEPTECNHIWHNRIISAFSKEKGEIVKMKECRKCGKWEEPTDNTKIEELDWNEFAQCDNVCQNYRLFNKLNEVIRKLNKENKNE